MLSRVADSFYWMSRYLERAEQSARILGVHASLALDDTAGTVAKVLLSTVATVPSAGAEPSHRAAVAGCVASARENARQIREQISAEMWEQLNTMYLGVARQGGGSRFDSGDLMREIIDGAYRFHGVTEATLSHGEGWHYVQLGRYIERAAATAEMLEAYFETHSVRPDAPADPGEYLERVGLLHAHAAFEAYCRCYTAELRPDRLAEFLLLNPEFPRSVRFAAERIEDSLRAVARSLGRRTDGRPERLSGRLRAALSYGTIDEIIEDSLVGYLQTIRKQCRQIHTAVYQTYITYAIDAAIAR